MKKILLLFLIVPFSLWSQLNGNYTIGTNAGNYATLAEAITALETQGVSGPVVFNFQPGSYSSFQFMLGNVAGTSATNTITFQSENLNAESVTITGGPWVVNAHHCIFKYLKFNPYHFSTPSNSHVFNLNGNFIQVRNCTFTNAFGGYYMEVLGDNMTIADNLFSGSPGRCIYRANYASPIANLVISGNNFPYAGTNAIEVNRGSNLTITNNTFGTAVNSSIAALICEGNLTVSFNKIQNPQANNTGSFSTAAVRLSAAPGDHTATVYNNFINSQHQNLYISYFKNVRVSHNNFKSTHNCLLIDKEYNSTAALSYQVRNNVFCSSGKQDIAVMDNIPLSVYSSSYNAFKNDIKTVRYMYVDNPNLEKYYTFPQWKSFSNKEANSKVVGYVYNSDTDLHTQNASMLNNSGVAIATITTDIDGQTRNAIPDIGADEFDMDFSTYVDIELLEIVTPTLAGCENGDVILAIKNNGATIVNTLDIKTTINDFAGTPVTATTLINPSETAQVVVPNCIIGDNTFYTKLNFIVSNPNNTNDNNFSNDSKTVSNILKLGDFEITVEKDNCGAYKSLSVPKIQTATVLWSTGATTQKIAITQGGTYSVTFTNAQGCLLTKSITLN
ncbi:hypothetical protein J2X31_000127 [Flavobacterium arsenatis]|uniref:Right handed beta helix domain-containing protein n=1 Tax=Flavobacterium arsenatis TaxID=1484332 RepID=A0ABU1TJG5_9FLAO|nr:right-handed parallel beta-helix repeat-containing protein [Flavobacterium arsenatis]MDR6966134.1 hypothetical protein [Flavobacterium arsenatis]